MKIPGLGSFLRIFKYLKITKSHLSGEKKTTNEGIDKCYQPSELYL